MKRLIPLLLAATFAVSTALAQKTATDEVGFNAEKLYDFHDIDAVALFNGNLTVTLPLRTYQVSSTLSYQFTLIYNGKNYDWEYYDDERDGVIYVNTDRVPARQSNAGLGWRVSLGRLLAPWDVGANRSSFDRHHFIYEGPSGDEHEFVANDPYEPVILSHDPQPLRLVNVAGMSPPTRDVEFPNGEVHRFQEQHSAWRLTRMRDRFGNWVNISYTYASINGKMRELNWTITDSVGRTHSVELIHHSPLYETWSLGQSIKSMTFDGLGGADNTYTFSYTTCGTMPVLQSVTMPTPDSTSYTFAYDPTSLGAACALERITLPTRGSISYTYQYYFFADETDVCANGTFDGTRLHGGIKTRTVSDGVNSRTWEYVQRRGPQVPVNYTTPDPCLPYLQVYGPFYWSRTSVLSPIRGNGTRDRSDHYFNIFGEPPYPDLNAHPFPAANELPFGFAGVAATPPAAWAKRAPGEVPEEIAEWPGDVSGSDGSGESRYLSTRVYGGCDQVGDCTNGTLLRSTYLRYRCGLGGSLLRSPMRCWVESTRTVHEDDTGCGSACYTQLTSSDRTGGGMHTTETSSSNFPAPGAACTAVAPCPNVITATTFTAYAPWPATDRTDATKPWITTTYSEQSRTEGTATATVKYQFAAATGAMQAVRVLKGSTLHGEDVLTVFGYDTKGNRIQEKSYGGDCTAGATGCTSLGTTTCCAAPATGLQYLIRHTYANNVPAKSEYIDPASCTDVSQPGCNSILTTADRTTDKWSGLVTSVRDAAGVETSFGYDLAGRIETITSPGTAARSYAYSAATATANARVTETVTDANNVAISTSTYQLDGLGRVRRISSTLPNGKLGVVQTDYDEYGRKWRVSQPVERTTHPTTDVGTFRTTYIYDSLGRPKSVTTPDNQTTTFAYTGMRLRSHSNQVATSVGGTSSATTVEHYDALGRLRRVDELSGGTSATVTSGAVTSTGYSYDPAGRLISVKTAGAAQPARTFVYDGRGFLTSETHPENGTTTATEFDARGHARKRTSGGRTVKLAYDPAERLTGVFDVTAGADKPLETFVFATANASPNLKRGKIEQAIRYNHLTWAGTIEVSETYAYAAPGGQMSSVTTKVDRVSGGTRSAIQQFVQNVAYDDLRLPKTVTMPACSYHGCSALNGIPSVTYGRTAGRLTSVQNFATLAYDPSGMVHSVQHASSPAATDRYDVSFGLPRPSSIRFEGGTACPTPVAPDISAHASVCPSSVANIASVATRAGVTHTWEIAGGGVITSPTTGDSIAFMAPSSGTVTLTVTATDSCGGTAAASKTVAVQNAPAASVISAPASVCSASTRTASVSARSGITHTWSIAGGTITSSATGESVTFSAGSSGVLRLTVSASDACGTSTSSSKDISITASAAATLSGSTTIVRGGAAATLSVALTGPSPWRLDWSDGHVESNLTTPNHTRSVAPEASMTYTVSVTSAGCMLAGSGSATVTVIPPPPATVTATTQANRDVVVTWPPVAGASAYRIERTTHLGAATTFAVSTASTSWADVVPPSAGPVAYIYYVRTVDAYGEVSNRGAWDYATAATLLYAEPQIVAAATPISAAQVNELRRAVDALRYAALVPAAFAGVSVQGGEPAYAATFTSLVSALDGALTAIGRPRFAYAGVPPPAPGGAIHAAYIQQLREALR